MAIFQEVQYILALIRVEEVLASGAQPFRQKYVKAVLVHLCLPTPWGQFIFLKRKDQNQGFHMPGLC